MGAATVFLLLVVIILAVIAAAGFFALRGKLGSRKAEGKLDPSGEHPDYVAVSTDPEDTPTPKPAPGA